MRDAWWALKFVRDGWKLLKKKRDSWIPECMWRVIYRLRYVWSWSICFRLWNFIFLTFFQQLLIQNDHKIYGWNFRYRNNFPEYMRIYKKKSILGVRTHFKLTETFQYTHFTSCHPPGVRKVFIKGEALRLLRANSWKATFEDTNGWLLRADSLKAAFEDTNGWQAKHDSRWSR